jgi:glycosyltransferase involved in cell wall biosynthesis
MDQTKKVLFLTSVHRPFDTRIYKREAISLVKAGYQVSLVAINIPSHQTMDGINIIGIPKPMARLGRILNWPRFVKIALTHRADIVHFHDPDLLLAGLLIKAITGKPVIYDCHELYRQAIQEKRWIPKMIRSAVGFGFEKIELALSKHLTVIIASPVQYTNFPQATLVKNYPGLEIFDLRREPARNSFQLAYLGTMSIDRGLTDLIEACHFLDRKTVRVVLMGHFTDKATEQAIDTLKTKYGLNGSVQYLGVVPYEKGLDFLAQSAIGVIPFRVTPALELAIPTKLFEYMACALPIVATDLPSITPVIEEADCGLVVPPENPKAFAEAIEYLLDNPQEAHRMGENGRRAVIQTYNWHSEANNLLKLYRTLLNEIG